MDSYFHWADYLLCAISLVMSIGVGVYYGLKKSQNPSNKTEEYLLGGRRFSVLPVSISMFVSWLSAISFIGDPVEVYYNGGVYIFLGLGYCLPVPIVAHFFAPVYNRMKMTSLYEFLEKRYSRYVRMFASGINSTCLTLYLAIVLYAPAVALSQVTGLKEWISILLVGVIGTLYTTMGGIRAVVWADTLQSGIMLIGLLAILIQGLLRVGGLHNVWLTSQSTGRANFLKNEWSPFVRATPIGYVIGGFLRVFVPYISSQTFVMRYFLLPTERDAKLAVLLNLPMYFLLILIFALLGLTMYTYYDGCDPIKTGRINRPDQLIPLFMMDMLGYLPGVPGIFLASLFAASLSSVSSAISSFATNMVGDFLGPIYVMRYGKPPSDNVRTWTARVATISNGAVVIVISLLTLFIKTNVFPLTVMTTGILLTPLAIMFLYGMYLKFVHTWHIVIGTMASFIICLWIGLTAFINKAPSQALPTTYDMCDNSFINSSAVYMSNKSVNHMLENIDLNITISNDTVGVTNHDDSGFISNIAKLSPLLYSSVSFGTTAIVSLFVAVVEVIWKKYFHQEEIEGKQGVQKNYDIPLDENEKACLSSA